MSTKSDPQPLDVIQGRRQVGVIFKVPPSGMGGRGGWAFKNMDTGRLFTFARLQEAKDEAWKSFAGCIFKRQKPLARLAPYARGTVAEPCEENPDPTKLAKSWASFDYWFFNDGHWVYGSGAKGYANAVEHWKGHGIIGRGDYPGPRPANVYAGLPEGEYQTYMQRLAEESGIAAGRAKNPLPDPANIIATSVIGSVARFVTDKVLRGNSEPATVVEQREENPVKKGGTLYTDHRGLAFRFYPAGRDAWKAIGAEGLGTRFGGENIANIEKRGDGLLYVLVPRVGQWWKPVGKNLKAVANYILSESDTFYASGRAANPRAKSIVPPLNQWHTFAGDNYRWYAHNDATESRPGDMHYFDLGPRTDARGKQRGWQVNEWNAGGGGHLPVRYFGTRNEALRYVREKMDGGRAPNPGDIHIDIQSHNTKGKNVRAKNPASAGKIVLALAGHPKGTGYYAGQTWDTELRKAIRFDSVAGAKAAAKLLAAKLPKGTRIEVRSM